MIENPARTAPCDHWPFLFNVRTRTRQPGNQLARPCNLQLWSIQQKDDLELWWCRHLQPEWTEVVLVVDLLLLSASRFSKRLRTSSTNRQSSKWNIRCPTSIPDLELPNLQCEKGTRTLGNGPTNDGNNLRSYLPFIDATFACCAAVCRSVRQCIDNFSNQTLVGWYRCCCEMEEFLQMPAQPEVFENKPGQIWCQFPQTWSVYRQANAWFWSDPTMTSHPRFLSPATSGTGWQDKPWVAHLLNQILEIMFVG